MNDLDAELERLRTLRHRHRARANQLDRESYEADRRARSAMEFEFLTRPRSNYSGLPPLDDLNSDFGIEMLLSDSHDTVVHHLPRPSRESGLRFEVAPPPQSDSEQPMRLRVFQSSRSPRVSSPSGNARRGSLPSIPGQGSGLNDPEDEDHENTGLTPGFAPAHSAFRSTSQPFGEGRPRRTDTALEGRLVDTPSSESVESSYPPLRRVDHHSPRPLGMPGPRVDGLGDRLRSPSPASDTHEEENWASLLTTMQTGRSSTATSFMSSRSDSRSGSNRSSQATTAATSFGEIGGDDSCDLDLPSGITEDDVREIRARHGRLRLPRDGPAGPDDSAHDTTQRDLARGNERLMELEVFAVILERMQRREDIPDEWWAAVGLSPDVVRGSA